MGSSLPQFADYIPNKEFIMSKSTTETIQINVGYMCNLACKHCHVSCGPNRKEIMERSVMESCLSAVKARNIKVIDITGGAPELNPNFRWFLGEACKSGAHVIVRTNLVILDEDGFTDIPELYAKNKVELVCSLPYYSEKDTDRQRGDGVFKRAIGVLKTLNSIGYAKDPDLQLNLVYNPGGAFLPPAQASMEAEYKKKLSSLHGIEFSHLYAITNNPVGRFAQFLEKSGNYDRYMERLFNAFNPESAPVIMCRSQISVGWNGLIYDCDFNQALEWPIDGGMTIDRWLKEMPKERKIRTGMHCYACTAGCGSSCGGSTAG